MVQIGAHYGLFARPRFGQQNGAKPPATQPTMQPAQAAGPKKKPVLLLVMDGWGISPSRKGNGVKLSNPKNINWLMKNFPNTQLRASGTAVGLPRGEMGNSEVGHLTMGAGRIVNQSLPRINQAITDGTFNQNPVFLNAIQHVNKTGGTLHLMGLLSDGGVHSHIKHLMALIDLAKQHHVKNVKVHAFMDGRDTSPNGGQGYLAQVEKKLKDSGYGPVATIGGRYYAMDRDNRWERVQKAYDVLVSGQGNTAASSKEAIHKSYQGGKTDEFVEPVITDPNYTGMQSGDGILFFNYRPDRARQITRAITDPAFTGFPRAKQLNNLYYGCMSRYDESFNLPIAYPKQKLTNVLGKVISDAGKTQFRTSETEKYAHVTYFFNGMEETPLPGEARKLIPSPKVATYDLQPEMSITPLTQEIVQAVHSGQYDFIVANYPNPDMVGHTGSLNATIKACKAVDNAVGEVTKAILDEDGVMLLTADHGNAEVKIDKQGNPQTAHTANPVPFVLVSKNPALQLKHSKGLGLSNFAPTILEILGLPKPADMTTESMLKHPRKNPFSQP